MAYSNNFIFFKVNHLFRLIPFVLCIFWAHSVFAVDSITLSPDSDITFKNTADNKVLTVQITPPEKGVEVSIDADIAVVKTTPYPTTDSEPIYSVTTDADGKAKFAVNPVANGMCFLSVSVNNVESDAIIVEVDMTLPKTITLGNADEKSLVINWNKNPNISTVVTVQPAGITNLTIHNSDPGLVHVNQYVSTDSSGSATIHLIANTAGIARLYATDSEGNTSNVLLIKVYDDSNLILKTKNMEVKTGETATLVAYGGSGRNYTWSSRDGEFGTPEEDVSGDVAGIKNTWTAPDYPGIFLITVRDDNQKEAVITISVTAPLTLYPQEVYLTMGEVVEFQASGGKPDYTFRIKDGASIPIQTVEGRSDFAILTAPEMVGTYTIVLEDSLTSIQEATIHVIDTMSLSRQNVVINQNPFDPETNAPIADLLETVTINNGRAPYSITVEKGDFLLNGQIISIIPPVNNLSYYMIVRDALGDVEKIPIETKIPGRLQIYPMQQQLEVGGTVALSAIGGTGPYTFNTNGGTLTHVDGTAGTATLIAENTDSDITVILKDHTGAEAIAKVEIIQGIIVSPAASPVNLIIGESMAFSISGGSGTYIYSTSYGRSKTIVQEISPGEVIFTAPAYQGEIQFKVEDTRGSTPATITINVQSKPFTITPSMVKINKGEKQPLKFKILTEYADVGFEVQATYGTVKSRGTDIIYTPPDLIITDTIMVTPKPEDGSDVTILTPFSATINVVEGFKLSPEILLIDHSETIEPKTINISGGAGGYVITSTVGDVNPTVLEKDGEVIYTPPGHAFSDGRIVVTDIKTNKRDMLIRISNGLKITPQFASVDLGGTVNFKILNGTPPYTVITSSGDRNESGVGEYTYTAPSVSGTYTLTAIDSRDTKVRAEIFVASQVKMTPTEAVLRPGESIEFRPVGGTPPYQVTAEKGALSTTAVDASESFFYRAPTMITEDEVTDAIKIYDSKNEGASAAIQIIKTPKSTISANADVYTRTDRFNINLNLMGSGEADVYVAMLLSDGATFVFFDQDGQATFDLKPYRLNYNVSDKTISETALSYAALGNMDVGNAYVCCVLVSPGMNLLDGSTWLSDGFSFLQFQLK